MAARKLKTARRSRSDLEPIRQAAVGRWADILASTGRVTLDQLQVGRPGPCVFGCGGKDRCRVFDDFEQTGGIICRHCFSQKNSDGFSAVMKLMNIDFPAAKEFVANFLGIKVQKQAKRRADDDLEWLDEKYPDFWKERAEFWCRHFQQPITPVALERIGARVARYRDQYNVIAIPVWGPKLREEEPIGWVCMHSSGQKLPVFRPGCDPDWVKKKTMPNSGRGIIGDPDAVKDAEVIWKVEGITDVLTWYSIPVGDGHAAFTNVHGCMESPDEAKWVLNLFNGKCGAVLHDNDAPGQKGALGSVNDRGERRPGWCERIAAFATECKNVRLPYEIAESKGKDLRDFVLEGGTFEQLRQLREEAEPIRPVEEKSNEKIEDYTRLARVNLEGVKKMGSNIVFWNGQAFTYEGGKYRPESPEQLRAKIWTGIKKEFDRAYFEEFEEYKKMRAEGTLPENAKLPVARNVTPNMVKAVYDATHARNRLPSNASLDIWLPDCQRRNYISMQNGILDVDAFLGDRIEHCLLPHTPDWFSVVQMNYDFDPNATCPKWLEFLEYNLEGDRERINLLQEWAGYMLLPDTSKHKFMILEGEGQNGKSVYCAGLQAILGGKQNCSYVPLEQFDDKYLRTSTLGKLVNISTDAGEVDRAAEGMIKAFVSGDLMTFEKKYMTPIEAAPTARLVIACNHRPHFRDRTSGLWRRMFAVPWRIQVSDDKRVDGMDTREWWLAQDEVPGMLNWALVGLYRLRLYGFTRSEVVEQATEEYRLESNPAKRFLQEHLEEVADGPGIKCSGLFKLYQSWAGENGLRGNLGESEFGKEVFRIFPRVERKRRGPKVKRVTAYLGINFQEGAFLPEELLGVYVDDF